MMQNWKDLEISTIYLGNFEQVRAPVNGLSPEDGSGYVFVLGREIKVLPLPSPWSYAWSEVVKVLRTDGSTFEAAFTPMQQASKTAIIDQNNATVSLLCDAGGWREMTEQELERERRAWSADMKDREHIKREWQEYGEG
ncbi:MAG TPA: hypothetical protein VIY29_29435 [Ktedonobacteraceae bacterium]